MKKVLLFLFLFAAYTEGVAQNASQITVNDIWGKYTFYAQSAPGFRFMNDGKHYADVNEKKIVKMDLTTGKAVGTILESPIAFDDYAFNADETKILLSTDEEAIYRRSAQSFFKIWDGKGLSDLFPQAKQNNAIFNAQGTAVAFTSNNNLYIKQLGNNKTIQVTKDGAKNRIINGLCDWVYEEEFSFTRAFEWSPDGNTVAYLRFDETQVPEFTFQNFKKGMYPENVTFKYPKVGERNSVVTVWLFDVKKGKSKQIQTGNFEYFPRLKWSPDGRLLVFAMNRHQSELTVLSVDVKTGNVGTFLKESRPTYVDLDLNDDMTFVENGKKFIKSSEQDGYNHIYLYDATTGSVIKQLTKGNWEVRKVYGVDEKRGVVYFQSSMNTPTQKEVMSVAINGGEPKGIATKAGTNDATFSSTFDYYILKYSTINTVPTYVIKTAEGSDVRALIDNKKVADLQKTYNCASVSFFQCTTTEGVSLNGWMMKPADFDASKKYPVFMTQYSGPGSQQVLDEWDGQDYWWHQLLTQKGYIVVCIDPRGTGGRGEQFKKMTYKELGKYETIDQIESAKWLGKQSYVDANRIGIFGWSYGGYMSSLCILKGNDVFKAAIAVAPVTNWKWYDNIYTERYMQTEKENPKGYADNSPVNFTDRLKGNYLLVHGMGDDNVHFQNAAEMVNALIASGKQFDTYYYPNRNHGIYGGNTRLHLYTKMLNFLQEKL